MEMLGAKQREESAATHRVVYQGICHMKIVHRRQLSQTFCIKW